MLRIYWDYLQSSLMNLTGKIGRKKIFFILFSVLPLTLMSAKAASSSLGEKLGVVKSADNASQWQEINLRLQQMGVNYCIIEQSSWEGVSDLDNISVLFLPNVANFNGSQAIALEKWLDRGGRVIASGATGNLSQPAIEQKLRSLLGGYWAYSLSKPTTLEPFNSINNKSTANLVGGAIVTVGNSKKKAVWISTGEPSAVVETKKATLLGWRWGANAVAPASFDIAWLETALQRYGRFNYSPHLTGESCNSAKITTDNFIPQFKQSNKSVLEGKRLNKILVEDSNLNLSSVSVEHSKELQESSTQLISSSHIVAISEEFANTIGRFESTIIGIAARAIGNNLSLGQFITSNSFKQPSLNNNPAKAALTQAKAKYTKFQQLLRSGQYSQAKQEWLSAKNILLNNYPTDRSSPTAEVRAIWIDRGTIVKAKGEQDLAKLFDRLAAAGINTVFFETLNASYPIYPSKIAPEQNPLSKGWDPLKVAVKLAKARDMEIHAWVWTFAAANQRHNEILNKPKDYLGPVLAKHPDWAMSDRSGRIFNPKTNKAFYDPANPEVRKYILSLIEEIATNYQVDGIQLDYIRYPFQSPHVDLVFGYSNSARSQFKAAYGVDPIEIGAREPKWYKWNQFKIEQVDRFVEDTSKLIKSKYPNLILSTAVFPSAQGHRSYQIQQNWEKWVQKGWIDSLVPMTYANTASELDRKSKPLFNQFIKRGTLILPGIRLSNVPDSVVVDQMQLLRDLPTGGYALFAAEYFNSNLENMLSRIQGAKRKRYILPYRQPFKATELRYRALQKEWIYLVSRGKIALDRSIVQEWAKKSDVLEIALKELADRPSNKNFLSARTALRSYQKQFPIWLEKYQQDNPYLVKAWSNRLKALEDLLSYGDRTVLNGSRLARPSRNSNRLVNR